MTSAQQSDDLADTVDYGALAEAAAGVVRGRSYRSSRALAGRLASALLIVDPPPRGGRGHGAQSSAHRSRWTWVRHGVRVRRAR